jgi:hypothetical protein
MFSRCHYGPVECLVDMPTLGRTAAVAAYCTGGSDG